MNKRTKDEQREIATKGGKRSGEVRREKKRMKDIASMLLGIKVKDKEIKETLKKYGISREDMQYQTAIVVSMINKALAGDVKASEFVRDTAGENPKQPISLSINNDKDIDPLSKSLYEEINDNAIK